MSYGAQVSLCFFKSFLGGSRLALGITAVLPSPQGDPPCPWPEQFFRTLTLSSRAPECSHMPGVGLGHWQLNEASTSPTSLEVVSFESLNAQTRPLVQEFSARAGDSGGGSAMATG